ncbi:MAG: hypothetical protein JST68_12705 [Bacteroidetes bacterium]|nr:hypothetical protein [Bacteroidota bacterium]
MAPPNNQNSYTKMAEQEVVKHTEKVYKIWTGKEHSFWHKCKEFLIEIFIIVFAVSISIWFHNRSEHAHQQEDVKKFLLGLKGDLTHDIQEMQGDRTSYLQQKAAFEYITNVKPEEGFNIDSLKRHRNWILNTTGLNPNNGRFEGFKASGRIGNIENDSLQNDIMDLYQENIVALSKSTDFYIATKRQLFDYLIKNGRRVFDSTANAKSALLSNEAQNLSTVLRYPEEVVERYDICIDKAQKIIAGINKEYDLKE